MKVSPWIRGMTSRTRGDAGGHRRGRTVAGLIFTGDRVVKIPEEIAESPDGVLRAKIPDEMEGEGGASFDGEERTGCIAHVLPWRRKRRRYLRLSSA